MRVLKRRMSVLPTGMHAAWGAFFGSLSTHGFRTGASTLAFGKLCLRCHYRVDNTGLAPEPICHCEEVTTP
jgi:hypothetical protein